MIPPDMRISRPMYNGAAIFYKVHDLWWFYDIYSMERIGEAQVEAGSLSARYITVIVKLNQEPARGPEQLSFRSIEMAEFYLFWASIPYPFGGAF